MADKDKVKKTKRQRTGAIKFVQHILITAAALLVLLFLAGSIVIINDYNGSEIYQLSASDQTRPFEDSVFFNTVLGRETEDVLRYVTIRTQLETKGVYDPEKIINVNEYNTRYYEFNESDPDSPKYYLGDLLKWSKYGFETKSANLTEMSVSGNYFSEADPGGEDGYYVDTVVNRYNTVDGHPLEYYAEYVDDYYMLSENLMTCAEDLYSNYNEYLKFNEYFDELNTNIRYCVIMGSGRDQIVYSNLDLKTNDISGINDVFKKYGRYISYDFDKMVYETNTAITESTFNSLMNKYKYAYPDDCRIYIAADMTMPADDAIKSARSGFLSTFVPMNMSQVAGIVILCAMIYLILLVICTILEGREYDEAGKKHIRLTEFDHTPIELWFIIFAVFITLFIVVPGSLITSYSYNMDLEYRVMDYLKDIYIYIAFGIVVFVFDVIMLWLYYSLVRRIKARHIWKQSFLYKIVQGIRNLLYSIYDNGNVLLRSVVPYAGLMLINLMLAAIAVSGTCEVLCVFAAIVIDVLAGIVIFKQVKDRSDIISVMKSIIAGDISRGIDSSNYHGDNKEISEAVNSIGSTIRSAVEQSMKDERMKSDLVANVSHDIRTPLTSIINYVDLIKRENITDPKISEYINVIDEKSQRLKTMTEDLIEASKVSSGNVELELVKINLPEMVTQALAEFDDKLAERGLSVVTRTENLQNGNLMADGRSLYRVMENLLGNVCKYAMTGTRVYVDIYNTIRSDNDTDTRLRITNVSQTMLPEDLNELTERFIRGDESRTSEGSGLGLSIAKSLTELMGGTFTLYSEADLFKAEIAFKSA